MTMTIGDMLAVLIAASTTVAIAQTEAYKPSKPSAHHPPRGASFLGHTSHLGEISHTNQISRGQIGQSSGRQTGQGQLGRGGRNSRIAVQRPATTATLANGGVRTSATNLSENNNKVEAQATDSAGAPESLHTAIR
jgi:hypothetical protein